MLKKLLSVIGVIVALLIWAVIGQIGREVGKAAFKQSPSTEKDIQNTLEEAAKQINAKTPIMIDAETRMDKATVGPGALLTYHYTFPNYAENQLDPNWVQTDLLKVVKSGVCANKKMKRSLEYGCKYKYQYSGKNGKLIGSFVLDRNDCGFSARVP